MKTSWEMVIFYVLPHRIANQHFPLSFFKMCFCTFSTYCSPSWRTLSSLQQLLWEFEWALWNVNVSIYKHLQYTSYVCLANLNINSWNGCRMHNMKQTAAATQLCYYQWSALKLTQLTWTVWQPVFQSGERSVNSVWFRWARLFGRDLQGFYSRQPSVSHLK